MSRFERPLAPAERPRPPEMRDSCLGRTHVGRALAERLVAYGAPLPSPVEKLPNADAQSVSLGMEEDAAQVHPRSSHIDHLLNVAGL